MTMQSSTNEIRLSNTEALEKQLQHVNLGLRGRDIFDLELTSDVDNIKVTVNNVSGVYKYANKVNLRKSDLNANSTSTEDMANIVSEKSNKYVDSQEQKIRTSDINNGAYDVDRNGTKGDTGLQIEVTYKITVHNVSSTAGTAINILDYYDSRYTVLGIYGDSNKSINLNYSAISTKSNSYNGVIIKTLGTILQQSETMDIYMVLKLDDPSTTLSSLLTGTDKIPTYNMAEIESYQTQCSEGQTEFTRGLIDKDSAPGSVDREQVRLTTNQGTNTKTIGGNPTTVEYYFRGNDLSKLKYEDDTYVAPTLYFVKDTSQRTITGTVFEDYTSKNSDNLKSGNGIKDASEPGINGVTVKLMENGTEKYKTTTKYKNEANKKEPGYYSFSGFLPGNYTIEYDYGDTKATVVVTEPNKKSYNGEDFQATNNSYKVEGIKTYQLSTKANYWYIDNENKGISVATDNTQRRKTVSDNVVKFTDAQMGVLNNLRDKKSVNDNDINYIIDKTKMDAATKNMQFEVEKVTSDGSEVNIFNENYIINNMNFGIAEVPVTTIDLQKYIKEFSITDSIGKKDMSAAKKDANGRWVPIAGIVDESTDSSGNTNGYSTQIEDNRLQGAKLQITFGIKANMKIEKNFDNQNVTEATIAGLVDFVDNDLSYNGDLTYNEKKNSDYWEVITYTDLQKEFNSNYRDGSEPRGTVDPDGTKYTTIVKAKQNNPLLTGVYNDEATITLEKVLSSTDSTIEDIISSDIEPYEYSNIVEITKLNYTNTEGSSTEIQKDRIRTSERYIVIPGFQYDWAVSDKLSIIPPTGTTEISTVYYVIAAVSLVILAVGAFGTKKFIVKK